MDQWRGAAGVCVDEQGRLLMVLQGKPEEEKRWSVPSGGREGEETLEQTCIREVFEETGYRIRTTKPLQEKKGTIAGIDYSVTYFEIEITGGEAVIQDPDGLIYEIAWIPREELERLPLSFEEDRAFLLHITSTSTRGT
ncbi:NUDIX hydrolase [Paenibacillus koleovorans]|uniref:NUDIX hydrolase n=1 Tax=Paenibacillus koleovorans TaxID=121608 RepID=UPI000FD983D0|nr:NUDIX hydrolase [Paenibacillus koleovorans]